MGRKGKAAKYALEHLLLSDAVAFRTLLWLQAGLKKLQKTVGNSVAAGMKELTRKGTQSYNCLRKPVDKPCEGPFRAF